MEILMMKVVYVLVAIAVAAGIYLYVTEQTAAPVDESDTSEEMSDLESEVSVGNVIVETSPVEEEAE